MIMILIMSNDNEEAIFNDIPYLVQSAVSLKFNLFISQDIFWHILIFWKSETYGNILICTRFRQATRSWACWPWWWSWGCWSSRASPSWWRRTPTPMSSYPCQQLYIGPSSPWPLWVFAQSRTSQVKPWFKTILSSIICWTLRLNHLKQFSSLGTSWSYRIFRQKFWNSQTGWKYEWWAPCWKGKYYAKSSVYISTGCTSTWNAHGR